VHGVFDVGGRDKVLGVIDEAWLKAQRGGPGVIRRIEDNSEVYIVHMGRRIGYVGGQAGAAAGKPAAEHIKLILKRGTNEVITAYPFSPFVP
jgi:hypothetical protein